MVFILSLVFGVALVFLLQYHWRRRHLYRLASKLPGPPALPIIGNGLKFMCKSEDILKVITATTSAYPKPLRIWFGPVLIIYFAYPQHIEKILSSSKLVYKHDIYDLIKIYLGDGLLSNSGEKHKHHRKLIQPLINLKFVTGNTEAFQRHINIFLKKLDGHVNQGTFDIHDYIHFYFIDVIGELMLGTQVDAQKGKNMDYIHATVEIYKVFYERLMRPWLHPDLIYNLTQGKKDQDRLVNLTTGFIKQKIEEVWRRVKARNSEEHKSATIPIIDQIANLIKQNPNCINDTDFLNHMLTLYLASEDTITIIASFLCVCMGMYPEYQKIAAEEIRSILGEIPREVTYDDIMKLQYLDMCVRDVLRLIPIGPIILRKTIGDFQIDGINIPKDCGVMVSIFDVHRDPHHWENPNHFHPDHFLPEATRKRHNFAYVPFSAGPRSCVGKVLAFIGLKFIMANILQKYEIEADGKFPDIVLKTDISVRSQSGYKVRLKKRIWK